MPSVTVGVFTLSYTLFTNAEPDNDIQFGMDFTVTNTQGKPMAQLIFPATAVGTNHANQWNVDNHVAAGAVQSIIFGNAAGGKIVDCPREIIRAGGGLARTKFAIYLVDVQNGALLSNGISFGYHINPAGQPPSTALDDLGAQVVTSEQKVVLTQRFAQLKYR